jgi:hypothetical protein
MPHTHINELLARVTPDLWRHDVAFSADVSAANERIFNASTDDQVSTTLNEWLQRFQPCLFGRLAAKCNQLNFCILRDSDLQQDDIYIRDKIQRCRTQWTRDAYFGKRSGFIIVAVNDSLANARPDESVAAIAHRLAELYLLQDVEFDRVHLEEIYLEQPGRDLTTWRWDAGINYFAAHGDKRWWHDHRIPGGIGFSINSVGHMAKSGLMRNALTQLDDLLGTKTSDEAKAKIESLPKALELAMTTIDRATETVSGRATRLLPLPDDTTNLPDPPSLPNFLSGKNYCEYFGYYHTDFTLPSESFIPDVDRPRQIVGHSLDFTYLFDPRIDNPAFITMGQGRRIRPWSGKPTKEEHADVSASSKLARSAPTSVPIASAPRLKDIAR